MLAIADRSGLSFVQVLIRGRRDASWMVVGASPTSALGLALILQRCSGSWALGFLTPIGITDGLMRR